MLSLKHDLHFIKEQPSREAGAQIAILMYQCNLSQGTLTGTDQAFQHSRKNTKLFQAPRAVLNNFPRTSIVFYAFIQSTNKGNETIVLIAYTYIKDNTRDNLKHGADHTHNRTKWGLDPGSTQPASVNKAKLFQHDPQH